ncbi:MAG: hypothetical protein EA394_08505 [Bacteroidia bacterium]|nr:MAG: hypothetical protein EA394_08505 [Bacteroidia bacterium]
MASIFSTTYAVFGKPVLHSKSPQLFSPILVKGKESYTRIRPQSAKDLVDIVRLLNIRGASITAPFKEEIFFLLEEVSPDAQAVGAVNCIRHENGKISGHNTDHYGVTGPLTEAGLILEGANILILGAGGAARAAVYGLTKAGANVSISNRTEEKAGTLAKSFDAAVVKWGSMYALPRFDAVVSTILPEAIPPDAEKLQYDMLLDAIYKPSMMTAHSRAREIPVIGGEQWLIHQGVEAAAFYIGKTPSPELLASRLYEIPDPASLRILVLTNDSLDRFTQSTYDLVVSAFGMDANTIKQLIDEEKNLAFGR